MKRAVSMFLCLCGMIALAPVGRANVNEAPPAAPATGPAEASTDQPYSAIWVRNVFDLKPNLPPPATNPQPTTPPQNVRLIGINTIFGNKRATLGLQEPGSKKEEYYTMTEGERRGSLEMLEINPTSRPPTVKIKRDESIFPLTFETNKVVGPPPGMGGPRPPSPMPGYGQPQPAGMSSGMMPPPAPLPNRTTRSSQDSQPNYGAAGFSSGYNYNNNQQQQQTVTAEQTAALLNLQQEEARRNGKPFPPLPPPYVIPSAPPTDEVPNPPSGRTPPSFPPGLGPRVNGKF